MHHIVSDGWTMGVLERELAALYEAFRGAASPLPELAIQYADYAAWQRGCLRARCWSRSSPGGAGNWRGSRRRSTCRPIARGRRSAHRGERAPVLRSARRTHRAFGAVRAARA